MKKLFSKLKHTKRSAEFHTTLYLALTKHCCDSCFAEIEVVSKKIVEIMEKLNQVPLNDDDEYKRINNFLRVEMKLHKLIDNIAKFRSNCSNQAKSYVNYMKMFENLLLFIRSLRDNSWRLPLSSLNDFIKYFFVHDQLNYARLTPIYIATMLQLEHKDTESWEYLSDNFSINKNGIPFTCIGSEHALEQNNKLMKINGGIVGITNNSTTLNRYCLIAPLFNFLSAQFSEIFNIDKTFDTTYDQLHGFHRSRLITNANKLLESMKNFGMTFDKNECLYNVITKAVIQNAATEEILNNDNIGDGLYKEFIADRLHGDVSLRSQLSKRQLRTFKKELKKVLRKKVTGKIVELKEERALFSRFLIAANKRSEIDLEFCLENYEFSVVPKSLFSSDGGPLPSTDKSIVMHGIEKNVGSTTVNICSDEESEKIIIIDAMAVVNQTRSSRELEHFR